MAKVLNFGFEVREFGLQLYCCVHFRINTLGKNKNPLIPAVMGWMVSFLFFYKDGFGIKWSTKVYMLLTKEKKKKEES